MIVGETESESQIVHLAGRNETYVGSLKLQLRKDFSKLGVCNGPKQYFSGPAEHAYMLVLGARCGETDKQLISAGKCMKRWGYLTRKCFSVKCMSTSQRLGSLLRSSSDNAESGR